MAIQYNDIETVIHRNFTKTFFSNRKGLVFFREQILPY
jgi:hypothetical protein